MLTEHRGIIYGVNERSNWMFYEAINVIIPVDIHQANNVTIPLVNFTDSNSIVVEMLVVSINYCGGSTRALFTSLISVYCCLTYTDGYIILYILLMVQEVHCGINRTLLLSWVILAVHCCRRWWYQQYIVVVMRDISRTLLLSCVIPEVHSCCHAWYQQYIVAAVMVATIYWCLANTHGSSYVDDINDEVTTKNMSTPLTVLPAWQ